MLIETLVELLGYDNTNRWEPLYSTRMQMPIWIGCQLKESKHNLQIGASYRYLAIINKIIVDYHKSDIWDNKLYAEALDHLFSELPKKLFYSQLVPGTSLPFEQREEDMYMTSDEFKELVGYVVLLYPDAWPKITYEISTSKTISSLYSALLPDIEAQNHFKAADKIVKQPKLSKGPVLYTIGLTTDTLIKIAGFGSPLHKFLMGTSNISVSNISVLCLSELDLAIFEIYLWAGVTSPEYYNLNDESKEFKDKYLEFLKTIEVAPVTVSHLFGARYEPFVENREEIIAKLKDYLPAI